MKKTYLLKENITGKEIPEYKTTVDVTLSDTDVTFEFDCYNSQFFSASDEYNGPLYDGDVCEAFICTDGDIHHYYEIEVAPNNQVFLAKINNATFNKDEIEVEFVEKNFVSSLVERTDYGYKLKFSVPLKEIGYDKEKGLLLNIYRIETDGGITDNHILAANPTMCDTFHQPFSFFKLK